MHPPFLFLRRGGGGEGVEGVEAAAAAAAALMLSPPDLCLPGLVQSAENIQLTPTINGILAGLVASSSTCAYVTPYAAFVIGIFAGAIYVGASKLMLAAK